MGFVRPGIAFLEIDNMANSAGPSSLKALECYGPNSQDRFGLIGIEHGGKEEDADNQNEKCSRFKIYDFQLFKSYLKKTYRVIAKFYRNTKLKSRLPAPFFFEPTS